MNNKLTKRMFKYAFSGRTTDEPVIAHIIPGGEKDYCFLQFWISIMFPSGSVV
jgi:hypothetical protein